MTSQNDPLDGVETKSVRRRRWRLVSLVIAIAVALGATIAVLNFGAGHANGASTDEPQGAGAEAEAEGENGTEKAPVPVDVVPVGRAPISSYLTASANLVAENEVRVLAEAQGRVKQFLVEEGDFVRRGQPLAYLVRDETEIALEKAKVRLANAERAYERSRDLIDKELISREAFDGSTLDFEVARQEVAEAEWQLAKTTIRAPFDGRISERMVQTGQHVRLNDELYQVTDFDPLIARIFLPEADIIGLSEGREVRVSLNADPSLQFDGSIRQISPIVDTATGTVKVTIEVPSPPSPVRPGSFVGIHIVRETRADVVVIPIEAVVRELKSAHVFVAEAGMARKRAVELGLQEGDRVEAMSGLAAGDQLIVAGQGGLKDSSPIKVLDG